MRKILLSALTLSALLAGGAASAATPAAGATPAPSTAPDSPYHAEWRQQFFDKIDTNHDGTVSRAEYQAWIDTRFAQARRRMAMAPSTWMRSPVPR